MERELYYYTPKEKVKNSSGNAYLTIDWFKKNFKTPIDLAYFDEVPFQEIGDDFIPPNIGWQVELDVLGLKLSGVVERVIQKKTRDREIFYILLKKY